MDTDRHPGSDSSNFNPPSWLEMNNNNNNNSMHQSSQNSPPLPDYHSTMGYGMPLDSTYGMSIPPPYTSLPLAVPSNQWPSIIATQSRFSDSGLPHISLPGLSQVAPLPGRKASTGGATPRRTLTDEDRRRMCVYHEEHKTAKQTDIGALFGVERSTVSKVLRQKEKYLNANDGSRSPIKRSKGRVPDIEKALSNWARNYQKQGYQLSDAVIQEKAHFFASTCGNQNGKEKVLSARWLEKFKNKYLIGTKSRKGSFDTNKSDSVSPTGLSINSALASGVQSPTVMSPISPTGFASPTSLSPTQTQDNIKNNLAEGLANLAGDYQQHKSTTSPDTLSASVASPTSTLVSDGPFSPTSQSHFSPTDTSNRPRSQTFPVNTIDPTMISTEDQHQQQQHHHHHHHHQQTTEQSQPPSSKAAIQDSLSLSILESPFEVNHNINNATADASNTVKRNRSIPEIRPKSIYPPIYSKSATVSPISPPGSPTQDEARRALELVMNYFQHQPTGLCAEEYVTIGKLMERLDLAKNKSNMLPGGLTRIDEHDDVPPHLNRKRSIHGYV